VSLTHLLPMLNVTHNSLLLFHSRMQGFHHHEKQ
jgi:hypothetical protein